MWIILIIDVLYLTRVFKSNESENGIYFITHIVSIPVASS